MDAANALVEHKTANENLANKAADLLLEKAQVPAGNGYKSPHRPRPWPPHGDATEGMTPSSLLKYLGLQD